MNIDVRGYGNSTFIPSLMDLWEYQVGYRFHANTGVRLAQWDDDWVVVADTGADPHIYSRRSGSVLIAQHGVGVWDTKPLYASPVVMVACIATLGAVVLEAGSDFTDAEGAVGADHSATAAQRLREFIDRPEEVETILATYGWTV